MRTAGAGDGLPPDAPRGRRAQDFVMAQLAADIRRELATQTEHMARLAGGLVNDVLLSATYTFDATGVVFGQFKVSAGSVDVDNLGANPMTVIGRSDSTGAAPTQGVGVRVVPKGTFRRVPLASREWAIYGTAGDQVSLAFYTTGVRDAPAVLS